MKISSDKRTKGNLFTLPFVMLRRNERWLVNGIMVVEIVLEKDIRYQGWKV